MRKRGTRLDRGDLHEAERMPVTYITYGEKDDVMIVGAGRRDPGDHQGKCEEGSA